MLKNPVVKDGIKALAIFLLPFLPYLHLFIANNWTFWIEIHENLNYDSHIESTTYYILLLSYNMAITSIWLANARNHYIVGTSCFFLYPVIELNTQFYQIFFNGEITNYYYKFLAITLFGSCGICYFYFKYRRLIFKDNLNIWNFLIICTPLFYFINNYVPESEGLVFYSIRIGSFGFNDFSYFYYIFSIKLCYLIAFLFWFFTEKSWWRYAILSPILLLINQFYNIFSNESQPIDEIELYQSGPFLLTILIALLILAQAADNQERIKAFLRLQYQHIEHAVEQRLGKQQQNIEEKKQRLATKKDLSKKELAILKKELEEELKNLS